MLYKLMIVGALLVGAVICEDVTDHEDCCSLEDKKELAFMWHQVWHSSYSERRVKIMRAVVQDILNKHPGAIELLKKKGIEDLDSPAFHAYAIKVSHGFDMVINMIEEPLVLEQMIELMADDFGHKAGLKKSYFETYADSFEAVLSKAASCFNRGAWHRCLQKLAHNLSEKVTDAAVRK